MDSDIDLFKKEREDRYGGEIKFLTYTKFLSKSSSDEVSNLNGIIYVIGKNLYFEDFEPQPSILLNKSRAKYNKFVLNIDIDSIVTNYLITEKDYNQVVRKKKEIGNISATISRLKRFLNKLIVVIDNGEEMFFFDIHNYNELVKHID